MNNAAVVGSNVSSRMNTSRSRTSQQIKQQRLADLLLQQSLDEQNQKSAYDHELFQQHLRSSESSEPNKVPSLPKKKEVDVMRFYRILLIHGILFGLSAAFIGVGASGYKCPAEPMLNMTLAATGALGILLSIFRCIAIDMKGWSMEIRGAAGVIEQEEEDEITLRGSVHSKGCARVYKIIEVFIASFQVILFFLFVFLWAIIFRMYSSVTYTNQTVAVAVAKKNHTTTDHFCDRTLFLFAFASTLSVLGILVFIVFWIIFLPLFYLGRGNNSGEQLITYNTYNYPGRMTSDDNLPEPETASVILRASK